MANELRCRQAAHRASDAVGVHSTRDRRSSAATGIATHLIADSK
jgi:hypothetical protein